MTLSIEMLSFYILLYNMQHDINGKQKIRTLHDNGCLLSQALNMQSMTILLSSLQPVMQQSAKSQKFTYEGPSHSL